jgi:DNA polymerase-3 subunit gamma/tau
MEKVSLYRKYRPQNFKNLVGQDHIRTTLANAVKSGHPAHAYLFCGPRGTGKTSTARLLAKPLNCLNLSEEGEPCDNCEMCTAIREGQLIDLIEIDAASNRGIDEIRELKDKINFAPTRAKNKIYIIDEVHMLTKEAFNALLKTLEEPPAHVFFVLATTEAHKVPETIISRCQRFDFKRISQKAIATRLMYIAQLEKIEVEEEAIQAIAHSAEGGLRDAIGLFEQLILNGKLTFERTKEILGITGESALENLYKFIQTKDNQSALIEIQELYAQGIDLVQFTKDFLELLRNKMIKATQNNNIQEIKFLLKIINNFQTAYEKLKTASIPQLPLEIAVIESSFKIEEKIMPQKIESQTKPSIPQSAKTDNTSIRRHGNIKNISEEERSQPIEKMPLTISYVKENWPRIIDLVKTPFVKLSLKEGKPISVENKEVTIEFTSNFHKDKIDTAEIKHEIENAFEQIFIEKANVIYTVRKIDFTLKQNDEDEKKTDQEKNSNSIANEALEIFGGELIEEEI